MSDRKVLAGASTPVTIVGTEAGSGTLPADLYVGGIQASSSNPVPVEDTWSPTLQSSTDTNDSDKEFTVPVGYYWQLLSIWVSLVSTGSAGNRQLTVEIQDGSSNVIAVIKAGVTQAASLTYNYLFAPGIADLTAVRSSTYLTTPIPPTFILPAGYKIRVYDSAAIAASADDMTVHILLAQRAV